MIYIFKKYHAKIKLILNRRYRLNFYQAIQLTIARHLVFPSAPESFSGKTKRRIFRQGILSAVSLQAQAKFCGI